MNRVVQKYGGSSVADIEKIRKVAAKVKRRKDEGTQVVVVVSAMGDTTDELLTLATQVAANPPRRELDMLLTCGERISMALLSMALQELKVPAISFTGSQSGIITDESHSQARIIEVKPTRLEEELAKGRVVIVAGFQGVSRTREVTTLGRGGSDTSAVALAAALGADCEIYSDVDGIFSADPRVVPSAHKLDELSHDEMQEFASAGAKVLNAQAVEYARRQGIVIHAKSTHTDGSGTAIRPVTVATKGRVRGVTSDSDVWVLSGDVGAILEWLDSHEVKSRWVMMGNGQGHVLVPLLDVHGRDALKPELAKLKIACREDLGTVTCVGAGLHSDGTVFRRALALAQELQTPVEFAQASSLQLTLGVPRGALVSLMQRLHAEFVQA